MMNNMMKVICISNTFANTKMSLNIGQVYFIDRFSIYLDADGCAFGVVYNVDANDKQDDRPGTIKGHFMLDHFKSVI